MAITTYSELKTAVENWIARADQTARIPEFIMLGEMRISRDLRIRAMEVAMEETVASGTITLANAYVELDYAYIDGAPIRMLERKPPGWIYRRYPTRSSDGKPIYIGREVDKFVFGPYPDSGYTVKGVYYARLPALTASNETNWFTANAPDLLLFAAMAEAQPFLKEDQKQTSLWEAKYGAAVQSVRREDMKESSSGSTLAMVAR